VAYRIACCHASLGDREQALEALARELRDNVTAYGASYISLAELVAAPLATLDARLARVPGLRCAVVLPE
jgi:predicted nucleic acid-binding protein